MADSFDAIHQRHYSLPHYGATFVHVPVRMTHHRRVGAEFKTIEHNARGLTHNVLHSCDVDVQPIERSADQHGIMDRRTHLDALFDRQTAGQAQHFGTIGLHREVPQGALIRRVWYLHPPAEYCMQTAGEHGVINRTVGPAPE